MPLPQCLYKYRSLSTEQDVRRAKDIFVNNRMCFAPATSFNDPSEGQVKISFSGSETEKLNHLKGFASQTHGLDVCAASDWARRVLENDVTIPEAHIHEDLRRAFREKASFCSLSEEKDQILMWAHYADANKGICIELQPRTASQIKWFEDAAPVKYQCNFPVINYYETTPSLENAMAALATKSIEWAYEKEWRLLRPKPGPCVLPKGIISGVIMGCAISDEHRILVHEWADSYSPPAVVYQARTRPGQFTLEIV